MLKKGFIFLLVNLVLAFLVFVINTIGLIPYLNNL